MPVTTTHSLDLVLGTTAGPAVQADHKSPVASVEEGISKARVALRQGDAAIPENVAELVDHVHLRRVRVSTLTAGVALLAEREHPHLQERGELVRTEQTIHELQPAPGRDVSYVVKAYVDNEPTAAPEYDRAIEKVCDADGAVTGTKYSITRTFGSVHDAKLWADAWIAAGSHPAAGEFQEVAVESNARSTSLDLPATLLGRLQARALPMTTRLGQVKSSTLVRAAIACFAGFIGGMVYAHNHPYAHGALGTVMVVGIAVAFWSGLGLSRLASRVAARERSQQQGAQHGF